ncbi:MAG: glycosyltransferase family 4 protein [Tannerellaceae bacterium]|jgi:glycosyltransferase involved in cell wall biosynthesis|nr:glycosyltransferase family 4 protein [Tannerellaceae bacterium]
MNIGFDAKRAVQNHTGLGNYSRYILEILSAHYPDNRYILFAPKRKPNDRLGILHERTNVAFAYPSGLSKVLPAIWRTIFIRKDLKKKGIDIFHGLSNELPVGIRRSNIKFVVSIHDLIFMRYPEFYKPIDRAIYRWKFRQACRIANKIIAISECTKRDIQTFFAIPEDKIAVVYQGCHPQFQQTVSEEKKQEVRERYALPRRYILSVGSIEPRKNLLLAAKALRELADDIHLVAIGKSTPYQQEIERYARQYGLCSRLHILNSVSFADLPAIYKLSTVFVYPSRFEGFGIPIIEALSCGVPVVASSGSCLEEAGGPASIYVHPDDANALARQLNRIINDKQLARRMQEAGKEYVKQFDHARIASEILRIYQSLHL